MYWKYVQPKERNLKSQLQISSDMFELKTNIANERLSMSLKSESNITLKMQIFQTPGLQKKQKITLLWKVHRAKIYNYIHKMLICMK